MCLERWFLDTEIYGSNPGISMQCPSSSSSSSRKVQLQKSEDKRTALV